MIRKLAVLMLAALLPAATTAETLPGIRGINHIGLTVPDLAEAEDFFANVLACQKVTSFGPFRDDSGIHPTQDEFILVQEGQLELKLDGKWTTAKAGDLVRMPRGVPHGYFNKSDKPARALFWVSPAGMLPDLFRTLHNMTDVDAVVKASAAHEVDFLPPDANA